MTKPPDNDLPSLVLYLLYLIFPSIKTRFDSWSFLASVSAGSSYTTILMWSVTFKPGITPSPLFKEKWTKLVLDDFPHNRFRDRGKERKINSPYRNLLWYMIRADCKHNVRIGVLDSRWNFTNQFYSISIFCLFLIVFIGSKSIVCSFDDHI